MLRELHFSSIVLLNGYEVLNVSPLNHEVHLIRSDRLLNEGSRDLKGSFTDLTIESYRVVF